MSPSHAVTSTFAEAERWLSSHPVSDTWHLVSRLRDSLVEATSEDTTRHPDDAADAIAAADDWLIAHRKTETWKTVTRLRDTLTRTVDQRNAASRNEVDAR